MANEDFIFRLGADISKFEKSISQVEAELNSVKANLKNLTGDALAKANAYVQELQGSLTNLSKVGFTGVAKGAQQGQNALFALGQVARDLPFGFIAIQNNLPLLVDQFVALKQTTGGAGKALGAILNSIAGPAGLAFGFGVLTSAITGLVQEYGSLSNALGQIFGLVSKTKIATEQYEKAQIASTAAGIAEAKSIDNLISVLENSKSSQSNRLGAYEGLKNVMPDVIEALDKEKTINGDNLQTLKQLAAIKKENIILDGTRQALIKAIEKETTNALTQLASLQKQDFLGDIPKALKGILKGYAPFLAIQLESIDQIEQSGEAFQFLNKILTDVDLKIATNTGIIKTQTEALKAQQKAAEEAAKARAKTEGRAEKDNADRFKKFIEGLKKQREEQKKLRAETFSEYAQGKPLQDVIDNLNKQKQERKEILELDKKIRGFRADFQESLKNFKGPKIGEVIKKEVLDSYKNIQEQTLKLGIQVKDTVENLIAAPLSYVFDTILEQGKFSWKEFGKVVLQQLAAILSRIIATSIAIAAADAITRGGYSATMKVLDSATGGGGVGRGAGIGINRSQAVNFGGVNAGGLAMTGAVSLSLRGSDLVGALNRTNTNINRIG